MFFQKIKDAFSNESFLEKKTEEVIRANALNLESDNRGEEVEIAEKTLISLKEDHGYFKNLKKNEISSIVKGVDKTLSKPGCIISKIKSKLMHDNTIDISYNTIGPTYEFIINKMSIEVRVPFKTVSMTNVTIRLNGKNNEFRSSKLFKIAKEIYNNKYSKSFLEALD